MGIAFGTANLGKDDIKHQTFTLYSTSGALTLDDIANVDFGVRLTSVGSPTGSRSGSSKLMIVAPAAPDARDDTFNIFEDGQSGLDHPATAASPLVFAMLVNDSDADHDTLQITTIDTPAHGTLEIVDGPDANSTPGDALRYTPIADYAGTDQFRYLISDGHGGTDFAWVYLDIAAAADVPTVTYTIGVGPLPNQVLVHVTVAVHDADGSEFIDRFEFYGFGNVPGDALLYTPVADYAGTDDFGYTISDGQGATTAGWVHVNVAAVADVPDIGYEILQGDEINQVIVRVTASDTDGDFSEYIDRFEFSGLPDGVQITALDIDPGSQPHTLVCDFALTLPDTQDLDFDFTVTAVAKESTNGDEESAAVIVPIDYAYASTFKHLSFVADDGSIWGAGAGTSFEGSDEHSDTAGFVESLSALDGAI